MYKLIVSILVIASLASAAAGCGPSRRGSAAGVNSSSNTNTPSAGTHFDVVRRNDPNGQSTKQLATGAEGLVFWGGQQLNPSGKNVSVTVTIYFGPWGAEDNTLAPSDTPYLFPNYADGAETGRGAADYKPIALTEVVGSGRQLWQATITTFPTSGTFLFTVTKTGNSLNNPDANIYIRGLAGDSSFDSARSSLKASYNASSKSISLPTTP